MTETYAAFLARGETAWQEYLRTGRSASAAEVFTRIAAAIDQRRAELQGAGPPSPADR